MRLSEATGTEKAARMAAMKHRNIIASAVAGLSRYAFTFVIFISLACSNPVSSSNGQCKVDQDRSLHCGDPSEGEPTATSDFVSYSCTGDARPDEEATYIQGVPQGIVCADRRERDEKGVQGYCCTARTTSCAYYPLASCEDPGYGFQCWGANRPEMLNPALSCGNGVRQDHRINYCCTGEPQEPGCQQSDSVACSDRLMGWTCLGDALPRGEHLGPNKSRADFYSLLCPTPTPAGNPKYNNYCCFMPALVPPGGSCVQNTAVPGCEPGRFGFSCYGPETPEEDYLPMHCPEPGFEGVSAEGYAATLYCCDFKEEEKELEDLE